MARMTLDQMQIFLAVVEHLHFTRAAETIHLSQSSVSAAIQNLEAEYGVKLFDRIGRHIEITQAGTLLQQEAKKVLSQVALIECGLRELNNLQQGELRVGTSINIGNYWLPEKICQFKRHYPGVIINCTLGNAAEISEGTASGIFDLGLVTTEIKPALKSLSSEIIGTNRIQIVVGQSHPWFERSEIVLDELLTTDWVMREPGSGVQQVFEQALHNWGINPAQLNVILVLSSSEMVKTAVESGIGAAAVPDLMLAKEIQLSTLHIVQVIDASSCSSTKKLEIVQPIWKLKHQQRFQTRLRVAFEQILRDTGFS